MPSSTTTTKARIFARIQSSGITYPSTNSAMGAGLPLGAADELVRTHRHGARVPADRVGHVVIADRRAQRRRRDLAFGAERLPLRLLDAVEGIESAIGRVHAHAQLHEV